MIASRNELIKKLSLDFNKYSPIVIVGEVDTGKKFFLKNLCENLVNNSVVNEYTIHQSRDVLDRMVQALSTNDMANWKQSFLASEVIIIEDFDYFIGRQNTQEELLSIFKIAKCPIIISATLPINNGDFCDGLAQFFSAGTYVKLCYPSHEDITLRLKSLIEDNTIYLSKEAYEWLLMQDIQSFTKVKGIVKTLSLYSRNEENKIGLDECKNIIKPYLVMQCKEVYVE